MTEEIIKKTIDIISQTYPSNNKWIVGFSGGKDSSLVLKLLFKAYENKLIDQETIFFYCDTGVENPIIDTLVKNSIKTIEDFAHARDYPVEFKILKPEIHQRFFVRIIGRGYPPPTNFFRWCTKDLRIRPAEKLFRQMDIADCGLCLGIRNGESSQRDRLNKKNGNTYLLDYKTSSKERKIFAPIIDFETADVWEALCELEDCSPVDIDSLAHIYRGASGECPVIRDPRGSPWVIIPESHWVENWTSPAFDALGEQHEEIEIHRNPDLGNFEAG